MATVTWAATAMSAMTTPHWAMSSVEMPGLDTAAV